MHRVPSHIESYLMLTATQPRNRHYCHRRRIEQSAPTTGLFKIAVSGRKQSLADAAEFCVPILKLPIVLGLRTEWVIWGCFPEVCFMGPGMYVEWILVGSWESLYLEPYCAISLRSPVIMITSMFFWNDLFTPEFGALGCIYFNRLWLIHIYKNIPTSPTK